MSGWGWGAALWNAVPDVSQMTADLSAPLGGFLSVMYLTSSIYSMNTADKLYGALDGQGALSRQQPGDADDERRPEDADEPAHPGKEGEGDEKEETDGSKGQTAPKDSASSSAEPAEGLGVLSTLEGTFGTLWDSGRKLAAASIESSLQMADQLKQNVESSALLHQGLDLSEQLLEGGVGVVERVLVSDHVWAPFIVKVVQ